MSRKKSRLNYKQLRVRTKDLIPLMTKKFKNSSCVDKNPLRFFTKKRTFEEHYYHQVHNRNLYVAALLVCEEYRMLSGIKDKILAAAFARNDKELMNYLLNCDSNIRIKDIFNAIMILDAARQVRASLKKVKRLESNGLRLRSFKLDKIKTKLKDSVSLKSKTNFRSFNGSLARYLKNWSKGLTSEYLERTALEREDFHLWRELARFVHFNPTKDFPGAPWFLSFCFGSDPPKDSIVDAVQTIWNDSDNLDSLVQKFNIPYKQIRFPYCINDKSRLRIVEYEDLDTIINNYNNLRCDKTGEILQYRLNKGETIKFGFNRLLNEIILFKNRGSDLLNRLKIYCEENLKLLNSSNNGSCVIALCMPSCLYYTWSDNNKRLIRIFSSLLSFVWSTKLYYISNITIYSLNIAKTISDVIDIVENFDGSLNEICETEFPLKFLQKESCGVVKIFIILISEVDEHIMKLYENSVENGSKLIFVKFSSRLFGNCNNSIYKKFSDVSDVFEINIGNTDLNDDEDMKRVEYIFRKLCSNKLQPFNEDINDIAKLLENNSIVDTKKNLKSFTY